MKSKLFILNRQSTPKPSVVVTSRKPLIKPKYTTPKFIQNIESQIPEKIIKHIRVIEIALGRLAMIGLGSATVGELYKHKTILAQFNCEPENIIILSLSILALSIYPAINVGYDYEDQYEEKVIGRCAMIAFSIFIYLESIGITFV
jgi:hypothetical protein